MTATSLVRPMLAILMLSLSLFSLRSPSYAQNAGEEESRVASALRDGDPAKALELLVPAVRKFPADAQLWTMQGVAYDRQGNKKEALVSFERALKIAPNAIPALEGAAPIHFDAGSPRAIPLLQHLMRLRPDDTIGHGMFAILEFQQGNCSAAIPHFEKAATLFQSQGDALHAYAICLVRVKELDKAATVLKRTAELSSNAAQELRLLASVELMAHQPEAALAALQPLLASGTESET